MNERDQQPVLAAVVAEQGGLQVRPAVDPFRAALEGRAVLGAHVDGHPTVVLDARGP